MNGVDKQNIPLLSIIIPVFNTECYIARCLDSILNQNLKEFEIIFIDDLSTDNSENIISEYMKKFNFIKYFKMQSKGLAGGARNIGLDHARGKYIGFVDSDDWIDTTMYKKMINLLDKSHADIAVCSVITEYDGKDNSVIRYEYKNEMVIDGKLALELLSRQKNQELSISAIVCNKVYRARFIKNMSLHFIVNNYNDDDVFNFLCFLNADMVALTPHTYYHYYQRPNSIMHNFSKKYIDDLIDAFIFIKNILVTKNIYELYKATYYTYFEKTLSSVLSVLTATENSINKQNEYIHYLSIRCKDTLIIPEYLNYVASEQIKRFLTQATIK